MPQNCRPEITKTVGFALGKSISHTPLIFMAWSSITNLIDFKVLTFNSQPYIIYSNLI